MKLSFSIGKKNPESESEPAKKKTANRGSGSGTGSFFAVSFIAVAVVVYCCIGVLFFLQMQQKEQAALNQLRTGAEALAAQLSDRTSHLRSLLGRVSSDPRLAKLLINDDKKALRAKERTISKILPDVWRVRLLPKEWNEPDTTKQPHLSFASLDILRTVERTKKVSLMEAHQFGSKHQHIALAAPIVQPGEAKEVAGTVHVAFKLNQIQASIDSISDYGGHVEVRQVSGEKALMLAQNPGAKAANDPAGTKPVDGSIWEVAYWPATATPNLMELVTFGGVPTAGLALIGLLMFFQSRRLKQALKSDQGTIIQMVESSFKGGAVSNPGAKVANLENTLELMAPRLPLPICSPHQHRLLVAAVA